MCARSTTMRTAPLLFALALPLFVACQENVELALAEPMAPPTVDVPLAKLLDSLKLDARTIRFHVKKSDRKFEVFSGDKLLKTYPCVLGERPVGDKYMQGDRKTPEGTFTFRSKRVHQDWHKFIWVDYPNAESWRRF